MREPYRAHSYHVWRDVSRSRELPNLQLLRDAYEVWHGISRHSIANSHNWSQMLTQEAQILTTLQGIYHQQISAEKS